MEQPSEELFFGFSDEWEDFGKRHPALLERFPTFISAITAAFIRDTTLSELIDKFVLLYGRLCCEDFSEVLLCCGNGYGFAGQKLVRSLYERAVTLRYLHEHPDELQAFIDFNDVATRKLLLSAEETFGRQLLQPDAREKVEEDYKTVQAQFMVTDCKVCGTKRLNHTWSKLDFAAMAKRVGSLGDLIVPAYYMPLRQAHATFGSLLSRLAEGERQEILFNHAAQRKQADYALMTAHNIMLDVLKVQDERFKVPELGEKIEECFRDFSEIYAKNQRNPCAESEM